MGVLVCPTGLWQAMEMLAMLGAIAGNRVGSVYEFNHRRTKDFPLFTAESSFTDDTILTVAVADVLLNGGRYGETFKQYYRASPKLNLSVIILSKAPPPLTPQAL